MRSRFYIEDPAPSDAEVYGNLKFARLPEVNGKCFAKAWRGKQGRPYAYYAFRNEERREVWIQEQKQGEDASNQYREEREAANEKRLQEMLQAVQVGTLLTGSWGYDQTNPELYRVIERKGRFVWIQCVVCERVEGSAGFDSEMIRPTPKTTGEVLKRMITANGVKLHECCTLSPDSETSKHYHSWYA